MVVLVPIAEPAGLSGEGTIKTAAYCPLELSTEKIESNPGFLLPPFFLVAFQHLSLLRQVSKQIVRSDKGIFRAGTCRVRPYAKIWINQMWVEGTHL